MRSPEDQLWSTLSQRLKARHFALVASIHRHRSLRKVAEEMSLSQPAVTKALKEIEDIVGTALFERTARGMLPTPAADLLAERSGAFLEDLRKLAHDLTAIRSGHHGVFRIGVIQFISYSLLTNAMNSLRAQGFRYRYIVEDGHTEHLIEMLRVHALDCVIGRISHEHSAELNQEVLYSQPAVVVASKGFRVSGRRGLKFSDLEGAHWFLPPRATPSRRAVEEMFVRHGSMVPEPVVEASSVAVLKALLKSNQEGVTILPEELAKEISADGSCRILQLNLDFNLPAVSLVTLRDTVRSGSVETLLQAVREAMG